MLMLTFSYLSFRKQGFTLLEVLIVLFVVSIMTGIAVISLPTFTQTDSFDHESERLKAVVRMLGEEAVLQSNDYGFEINLPEAGSHFGYSFYLYDARYEEWQLLMEPPFNSRELPAEIRLFLEVEGKTLDFLAEDAPPVLILSSGEITPFDLRMSHAGNRVLEKTLTSDGYSDVDWAKD